MCVLFGCVRIDKNTCSCSSITELMYLTQIISMYNYSWHDLIQFCSHSTNKKNIYIHFLHWFPIPPHIPSHTPGPYQISGPPRFIGALQEGMMPPSLDPQFLPTATPQRQANQALRLRPQGPSPREVETPRGRDEAKKRITHLIDTQRKRMDCIMFDDLLFSLPMIQYILLSWGF